MREYWRLLRQQTSLLTYGVALTFMSSVGQTFLVSLFVPYFIASFALSEGGFGVLYSPGWASCSRRPSRPPSSAGCWRRGCGRGRRLARPAASRPAA